MEIKVLNSTAIIPDKGTRWNQFVIGTHNGIFHSDEVVACAILCLLREEKTIWIVRTRNEEILKKCDICVDVGGGDFDHHQPEFKQVNENGVLLASAGLVFKQFGKDLIVKIIKWRSSFSEAFNIVDDIVKRVDNDIISLVDCEDNGIKAEKHCFSFIPDFLPLWNESDECFESQFYKVLKITVKVLIQELNHSIATVMAEKTLKCNWKNKKYFFNNILEIPSQTIPWLETIVEINSSIPLMKERLINFVIFPYPDGGWAAQCVPPSLEKKFEQRVPFPKEWAGQTVNLPEISTVDDAIFCHNGRFFARAKTKEGIIKMCKITMKK